MKRHASGRSELLLIEIIIAVLFFSIASAICLQLFVRSHALSEDTQALNMSVAQTSSVAAILNRPQAQIADIKELYPQAQVSGGDAVIYYDSELVPCEAQNAAYTLNVTSDKDSERMTRYTLEILRQQDGVSVYQTELLVYSQYTD